MKQYRRLRVGIGGTVCASVFTRVISEWFTDALQERLTIHVHILGTTERAAASSAAGRTQSRRFQKSRTTSSLLRHQLPQSQHFVAHPPFDPVRSSGWHNYSAPFAHVLGAID